MITDKFAKDCAKAIARALCDTLGVSYPTHTSTDNSTNNVASTKMYRVIAGSFGVKANAEAQMKKLQDLGITGVFLEAKNVEK